MLGYVFSLLEVFWIAAILFCAKKKPKKQISHHSQSDFSPPETNRWIFYHRKTLASVHRVQEPPLGADKLWLLCHFTPTCPDIFSEKWRAMMSSAAGC